jgi:hypothetical protein
MEIFANSLASHDDNDQGTGGMVQGPAPAPQVQSSEFKPQYHQKKKKKKINE